MLAFMLAEPLWKRRTGWYWQLCFGPGTSTWDLFKTSHTVTNVSFMALTKKKSVLCVYHLVDLITNCFWKVTINFGVNVVMRIMCIIWESLKSRYNIMSLVRLTGYSLYISLSTFHYDCVSQVIQWQKEQKRHMC